MRVTSCLNALRTFLRTSVLSFMAVLAAPPTFAAERSPAHKASTAAPAESEARVIVKFRADSSLVRALSAATSASTASGPQSAQALAVRLGIPLTDGQAMGPRTQLVRGGGIASEDLATRLSAQADVEYAVADKRKRALAVKPNDPLYLNTAATQTPASGQWYLQAPTTALPAALNAEAAWAITVGKSSIVVADLDTGIRSDHPDLTAKLLPGYDFVSDASTANDGGGRDADPSDPGDWITAAEDRSGTFKGCGASDSSWHGTQTAGLIGAATNNAVGMASVGHDVMILPVRVLGRCGGYDSDIIDAMRWAAGLSVAGVPVNPYPAKVVNMSLGGSGACSQAYQDVISELVAANVVVVIAAGNDGLAVGEPANCSGAIAVAGVRHTGTKVGYSDLGPAITLSAPAGNCVNATGTCLYPILTTSNSGTTTPVAGSAGATYTSGGDDASLGTSFSAPLVSGTVALMLSANAALSPAQVTAALRSTARPFPSTGADAGVSACTAPTSVAQSSECYCTTSTCGAGLLDAGLAVAAVASAAAPTANIVVASTSAVAGTAVSLSGSTSSAAPGASISNYLWAITSGASIASITSSTSASTVTLLPTAAGTVTVSLTVTDSAGRTDVTSTTLTVTAPAAVVTAPSASTTPATASTSSTASSSGGGAMNFGWLLGLLGAVVVLRIVAAAKPMK